MSIKLATIASGSNGNSSLVISGNTVLMSDCGISFKRVTEGLSSLGVSSPDALLVTHSHTDHVGGALAVAKKFDIPIYMTSGTKAECQSVPDEYIKEITPGVSFSIGEIDVTPFGISHDTSSPVAFTFLNENTKAAIMTDTGIVTDEMIESLKGAESIIIESNHDEKMLFNGTYPYFLKKRISGKFGHMSNELCATVCKHLAANGTKNFILSHLSEHNNTEELAFQCTDSLLKAANINYTLKVAKKNVPIFL